jgi:glutamate/tyrosine decarboxylase-like PLP-dependent enzyme
MRLEDIDGTLNPGGSMSNMMALLLARHEAFPHVKRTGWQAGDKPVAFAGAQAHYSIQTATMVAGMGANQLVQVPSIRETSQIDTEELEKLILASIARGEKPFFVNAVAGTTVMGAFDDFQALRTICDRYGLWLHVDACWGGFLTFASPKNRSPILLGIEHADSISFNPHKGLGVPLQCSLLLTNKKRTALLNANSVDAEYLFQMQNMEYDNGRKTLGCGRKADALKLWLAIRKHGLQGLQEIADNEIEKAQYMAELINNAADFELVGPPMGINVCYWYTPAYFQKKPEEYTHTRKSLVHMLIFDRMKRNGHCLVQQQPLAEFGLPNFFRLALGADRTNRDDMEYVLHETRRLGQDITPKDIE